MNTRNLQPVTIPTALTSLEWSQYQKLGSVVLLVGMFLTYFGLAWDIEWHADVGPDTFWTIPHLFVYAGAALAGFACLTVVLLSSVQSREGWKRPGMVPIFGGLFYAPVGFIAAGFGSLGFLMFGFFDQWWHTLYGFDVAISSAPHVGLILSAVLTNVGGVIVFAQGRRSSPILLGFTTALALCFSIPLIQLNIGELNWIPLLLITPALAYPLTMMFVVSVSRTPVTLLWTAGFMFILRSLVQLIVPLATNAYAVSLNQLQRENADPQFINTVEFSPAWLLLAAIPMFALLYLAKARGWRVAPTVYAASALCALSVYVDNLLGPIVLEQPMLLPPLVIIGMMSGWVGWRLGVVTMHSNDEVNVAQIQAAQIQAAQIQATQNRAGLI
jgi:hypothetical protein